MKTIATAQNKETNERFEITAYSAYQLKENNPSYFKKLIFWKDKSETPHELTLVQKKHCFFRYKVLPPSITGDSDNESIKHQIAKEELSKLRILHLVQNDEKITVYVNADETVDEKTIHYGDIPYRVDLYFSVERTEPKEYLYKWGGVLAIEVEVTHKTETQKKNHLLEMEIPVFEIKLSKKIMRQYKHEELLTDDDIHNMHLQFSNMFKRNIYGKFISNPIRKEYSEMLDYIKEIQLYKEKIKELEKIYDNKQFIVQEYSTNYHDEITAMNKIVDLEQTCANYKYEMSNQNAKHSEEETFLKEKIDTLENKCNTLETKCDALENTLSQKNIEISSLHVAIQNARLSTKIKKFFQRLFYKS